MCFNLKAIISKQIARACMNCRVSQRAAFDSFSVIIFKNAGFWKYLNTRKLANLKSRTINKHVKLKRSVL